MSSVSQGKSLSTQCGLLWICLWEVEVVRFFVCVCTVCVCVILSIVALYDGEGVYSVVYVFLLLFDSYFQ